MMKKAVTSYVNAPLITRCNYKKLGQQIFLNITKGAFTYDITAFFIIFDPLPPPCHPFYYISLCTSVTFWRPPSPLRRP